MNVMTVIYFLLILGIILIVHEVGHLVTAKYFGVYCREFSIGMGPVLLQKQGKETKWSLRLIPIGGYVMMAGDDDAEALEGSLSEEEKELVIPVERTLPGIAKWKQAIVMFAGSFMNILLAFVVFVIVVFYQGSVVTPTIGEVFVDSPAMSVGLQVGDTIVAAYEGDTRVEVNKNKDIQNFQTFAAQHTDGFTIVVDRDGTIIEKEVTPKLNEKSGQYLIGIAYAQDSSFGAKMEKSFDMLVLNATMIVSAIANLFRGQGLDNIGGPVGILSATADVAKNGFMSLVLLLGMLSINVGLFNLVPIPLFDGGRIVILAIEAIIGRDLNEKARDWLMYIGLFLVLALFVLAAWNDISRLLFK